jgi:DNA-binding transcriptional ArsR family regulator
MSPRRDAVAARVADAAPVFFALGDETRLKLVARLSAEGPLSIATLSAEADVTRQAVTKHLRALADVGLVRCRPGSGRRQRLWEIQTRRLEDARRFLDRVSRQWDDALDRLRAFVEEA